MGRMTWIDMRVYVGAGWGEDIPVLTRRNSDLENMRKLLFSLLL
jgi:hypothetical protein